MAITRVFRVRIMAELRKEFEEKFADISAQKVQGAPGLQSVAIHRPTEWSPDESAMITVWTDEASLASFAGENWNQPVIPDGMEKFVQETSVAHYRSWN